jgi:NTP pyrophosphatase (non-canonical NTP hydrolase)
VNIIGDSGSEGKAIAMINALDQDAHEVNRKNGWWVKRIQMIQTLEDVGIDPHPHLAIELLGLVGTEVSEAIEAARNHPRSEWKNFERKDSMVREMADVIIRLMDLARFYDLPLGAAVVDGIIANQKRGHMHGGKAA